MIINIYIDICDNIWNADWTTTQRHKLRITTNKTNKFSISKDRQEQPGLTRPRIGLTHKYTSVNPNPILCNICIVPY